MILTITAQLSLSLNQSIKKMMQQELLVPAWPSFNFASSVLDHNTPYDQDIDLWAVDGCDLSASFASPMMSSSSYVPSDEFCDLKDSNKAQACLAMEGLEAISRGDIEEICEWLNGDDIEADFSSHDLTIEGDGWSPLSHSSSVFAQQDLPLVLPVDMNANAMEVDDQLMLMHLLQAYGEAMEKGEMELAGVIANSISDKSSPLGNTTERVAYNLFQSREGQGEYLREESSKNLAAAFKVMYQSLPNGRFAHFTANSAILESIPDGVGTVQIVDFDMGDGVQWPPLIEALSRKGKAVRLTAIRSEEENTSCWEFDDTKKRLLSHARQCGVSLEIEEKSLADVGNELMPAKRRRRDREWVAFNCMVGLPHMGRRRPRRNVNGFLEEAKALVASHGGILVLGDGEDISKCCSYSSYFDSLLRHYQAVFESLESSFPAYLAEARAAMECLFLAPLMCPTAWSRDWEETRAGCNFQTEMWSGSGGKLSLRSLVEASDLVVEGESSYSVKMEGRREEEMVLRWKETPLVRVSTWM